ncbi:M23 family metallopeptidase [Paenibacillus thalictri]|uniref:Peptidase M23 n=1 Tax=Paenibacillus thalictri TaxID=2527873 RepID=A0A4Q9DJB0_9BACL|nr:M23 family metallopeptidase [Paenibacillus thalictri]TBL71026.1 peptidase M23 [Paenibacillus thalictri]
MKLNWRKKKLTFVIIPDAHSSAIRLRVPHYVIYTILLSLVLVLATIVTLYRYESREKLANEQLATELSGRTIQFDQTLAGKNEAIEQLQNDVIQLSQQATEIKQKMEEMKTLEKDLRSITQGSTAVSSAISTGGQKDASGLGGVYNPVSDEEIVKLSEDTKTSFTAMTDQLEKLKISLANVKEEVLQKQKKLKVTPTLWPVTSRVITSPFGYRKDPFNSQPSFHSGMDIAARLNSPVVATADGIVVTTGSDSSHGNNIIIDHSNGLKTWYMHLNKILVSRGDTVQKGQQIGLVGSTGRSTGAHLHYELLKNGQSVDPLPYLTENGKD